MKTIKKGREVQRTTDVQAEKLVKSQGWKYCPKHEWKVKVRDAKPVETKKKVTKKKKDLKKLFGAPQSSSQCDAKYAENPKANAFRGKVLGKKKK